MTGADIETWSRDNARFAAIYAAVPVGIVETDLQQRILRCNPAFATMVGSPVDKIVGRHGWDFFHPDSPPPDLAAVAEFVSSRRTSYSAQRLLRKADGSPLPVKLDWAVIRDEAGEVVELACVVTDISTQARVAMELQQARERAEVLWRQAPIGIVESTPDGVITSANEAFGAMLGYRPEDLIGRLATDLLEPAHVPIADASDELLVVGHGHSGERCYLSSDGRSVPALVSTALLHDENGDAASLTGFVVDMSETRAQRAALDAAFADVAIARDELASRQVFSDALLETIDVGIVSCDADGGSMLRNGTERSWLGLSAQHAESAPGVAATMFDIFDAAGERVGPEQFPLARTLRGEVVSDTDFRMGPRGGPYRDVVIRGSQITTSDALVLGAVVAITDVTAERNALRELATERQRLTEAQRLGQLGSFTYDVASGQYTFSAEMLRIWGLAPDDDLIARRRQLIHPDDLSRVVDGWNATLSALGKHTVEYRIVRPDGRLRHLRVSTEVVLDSAGAALVVHGTHLDVTDLTVAQRDAVRANALFTAILAATPDYTFVTDVETGAVVYGPPGKSILGVTTEQLQKLGASIIASLVHPDEQSRLHAVNVASRDLADGEILQLRYQARNIDGSWHWLDRRVTPFRRDQSTGRVVEVLGVISDVTDEYRVELALRDSEARFRALVSQVVDYAIIGLDAHGVIESWNAGAEQLEGYTAAQAIGRSFTMFYTADDRTDGVPLRLLDAARSQGRVEQTGWSVRRNGSRFWAHTVISALRDEQGTATGFVKVTRDLTAQRQLEKAQATLFATVSHDLRNPITAIKGYAELMTDVDPATQTEFARRIGLRADHLAKLVDGLFDYAKLRTEPVPVALEPLALSQLARSCVDNLGPLLSGHPVEVQESDLVAMADRTAMNRILDNLLSNAARYSPAGSPLAISFGGSEDLIRLRVTDQGRGIAPEDLDTIFTEFNRGRFAEDDGGTGLGLASVRHLVTLQGGRTWIDSEVGQGTTVTVELARAMTPDLADSSA